MRRLLPGALTCLAILGLSSCEQSPAQRAPADAKAAAQQPAPAPSEVAPTDPSAKPAPTPEPEPAVEPPIPSFELPSALLEPAPDGYTLVEAGAEPRAVLRFHPSVGQVETIKLTMRMTMAIGGAGIPPTNQKMPPIEQVNRAETISVTDGRIEERIVFQSFSVSGEGVDPQVAAMLQATMEEIRGFEQVMVYDERGGVLEGKLEIPEGASPQLAQTLETMGKTFEQVLVRLPEPAVGVGATWRETSTFDNNGMELQQTSQFEILEREGEVLTLATQITQRPLSDVFKPPNMPETEVKLIDFDSKGAGRVVYDLAKLMPTRVDTRIETSFEIEAAAGGQTQRLTTRIEIDLSLERTQ